MGRKKKLILNQTVTEPKIEIKVETPIEEKPMGVTDTGIVIYPDNLPEEESLAAVSESEKDNEISLKVSGEKLAEVLEKNKQDVEEVEDEAEEDVVEEVPRPAGVRSLSKEVLNSLSRRDLRWFQRTGKLPQ